MKGIRISPRHRPRSRSAFVAAVALLLGACGGDTESNQSASATSAPRTTEAAAMIDDPTRSPEMSVLEDGGGGAVENPGQIADEPATASTGPAPPPSGNLKVSAVVPLTTWNPHVEQRLSMHVYYTTVYEKLVDYDNDLRLRPDLATSWTVTEDAIDLTLREGVVFHDGTPFDAAALQWNIDHARATPSDAAVALEPVERVEILDDHAVRLHLSRPAPQLIWQLAQAPGMMISPATIDPDTTPVGTGPWRFDADASGPGTWVFRAFPDYHDPTAQGVESIRITLITDGAARLNAMQQGEIDIALVLGPQVDAYRDAGLVVEQVPTNLLALTLFDRREVGPFGDRRVRQAISHAIDRDRLLRDALGDVRTTRYVAGEYGGSAATDGYPYDPDRARALLADAGAEDLTFTVPSFATFDNSNLLVQAMLAEVGITMNIETIAPGTLATSCAAGGYDACIHPVVDFHPASYFSDYIGPNSRYNPFGLPSPAEPAAEVALREADFTAAEPLWAQVAHLADEDLATIILLRAYGAIGLSPDLVDPEPIYNVPNGVRYDGLRFAGS